MAAKKIGRPSLYTPELGEEICRILSTSDDPIGDLCDKYSHWPSVNAVYEWRVMRKDFGEMYARAKANQIECLVDRAQKLSRSRDYKYENERGEIVTDSSYVPANRLEIDTIKWFACKLAPKIYGDKIQQDITVKTHEESIKDLK